MNQLNNIQREALAALVKKYGRQQFDNNESFFKPSRERERKEEYR